MNLGFYTENADFTHFLHCSVIALRSSECILNSSVYVLRML